MGLIHGIAGTARSLFTVIMAVWDLMEVVSAADAALLGKATPRNMEQIVIGRCEEYQRVIHPELFQQNELKNCTVLWQKLRKAFANKGACDVTVDSYQDFVEAAYHKIDTEDKMMYWSGPVYQLALNFVRAKNNQYMTIHDTLAAYVLRNIDDWCGQVAAPGINHNECPLTGSCPNLAADSFWIALSINFAKEVKGTVHVLLNGSTGQAYRRAGVFFNSELKNLVASQAPTLQAHLAYSLNGPIKEKCGEGTIVQLRQDAELKGMKFKCSDDDLDIQYFQCLTDMQANRCKDISPRANQQSHGIQHRPVTQHPSRSVRFRE